VDNGKSLSSRAQVLADLPVQQRKPGRLPTGTELPNVQYLRKFKTSYFGFRCNKIECQYYIPKNSLSCVLGYFYLIFIFSQINMIKFLGKSKYTSFIK